MMISEVQSALPKVQRNTQPVFQPVQPSAATLPKVLPRQGVLLRFGRDGNNILWFNPEPHKVGGLGAVSWDIPLALNMYQNRDVRIIAPLLKPIWDEAVKKKLLNLPGYLGGLQATGLKLKLKLPAYWLQSGEQEFELWQQFEAGSNGKGVWKYFIGQVNPAKGVSQLPGSFVKKAWSNDAFGNFDNLYIQNPYVLPYGSDAIFKANMLFSKLAAMFAPYINGDMQPPSGVNLNQFTDKTHADIVMAHDWMTGPALYHLAPDYANRVGKVFMVHNFFDQFNRMAYAAQNGFIDPSRDPYNMRNTARMTFSPLATGVAQADVVIVDKNFAQSIIDKISGNIAAIPHLQQKMNAKQVFSVEHAANLALDARTHEALKNKPFVQLKTSLPFYKQKNKRALLALYSEDRPKPLPTSPNSQNIPRLDPVPKGEEPIIFTLASRLDVAQKGFKLIMDTAEEFITKSNNPNIRFIISATGDNPQLEAEVEAMQRRIADNPKLKGKISISTQSLDKTTFPQVVAGSDFFLIPSTYEPYGVTQKEAMTLGTIPLASNVDGLKSTLYDPQVSDSGSSITQKQNALLFKFNNVPYLHAMWRMLNGEARPRADKKVIDEANGHVLQALNRALALVTTDKPKYYQIIQNGLEYARARNWETIVNDMYTPIINAAMTAAQNRQGNTLAEA